jgi:hypothetical protein
MPTTFPPIGQAQPELNAIFAGLARGQDNQPDYGLVLNTARPSGELTWEAAKAWAASLGEGWRLPTRNESALLYAFLRDQFERDWYWTSEAQGSAYAWICGFYGGNQLCNYQSSKGCAVAVRSFDAESFNPSAQGG